MAQKYRKIDPRLWDDEKFWQLTSEQKLVALRVVLRGGFDRRFDHFASRVFTRREAHDLRRPDLCTTAWKRLRMRILLEQGTTCSYCGQDCASDPTIDHVNPVCGGTDPMDASNLVVACRPCNSRKGGRVHGAL